MDANNILRSNQACVVEIARFEKESVEGFEAPIIRVVVAAGGACLEPNPRRPGRVPGVAGINGGRPREDGIIAKAADLEHLLGVPVPMVPGTEFTGTDCVPMLVSRPGGKGGALVINSQIIEIQAGGVRAVKVTSGVESPKRGRMILCGNMARIFGDRKSTRLNSSHT